MPLGVLVNSLTPVALALILGTILGEGIGIERNLKNLINRIADTAGCLITLAAGFKVAGIKNMRAMNMLPALLLVLFFSRFWTVLVG